MTIYSNNKGQLPVSVLIVDDDFISMLLLKEFLLMESYKVVCAQSGKEALSIIQNPKNKISIVLMDILMPKMNGIETAKKINAINHNLPIIAQTAQVYNLKNLDLSCFDDVITKPINFISLKDMILRFTSSQSNNFAYNFHNN